MTTYLRYKPIFADRAWRVYDVSVYRDVSGPLKWVEAHNRATALNFAGHTDRLMVPE